MAKFLVPIFCLLMCAPAWSQIDDIDDEENQIEGELSEPGTLEVPPPSDPILEETNDPAPATQIDSPRKHYDQTPSGPSEKIFDWSKHKNAKEVPHPFAEKGLLRVKQDGVYVYKTEESPQKAGVGVRFGVFNPSNLVSDDTTNGTTTFEDNYDQTDSPAILIDYERNLFKSPLGKLAWRAGSGVYVAQGHGHFASATNASLEPMEVFTFIVIPWSVGAIYRMQVWNRQLLIPYAEGGVTEFTFAELRDDDKSPKFGASPAAYYAFGGALNLTYWDAFARTALDREYGINRVYLTAEFRGIVAIGTKYDFSGDLVNAGLLMEY